MSVAFWIIVGLAVVLVVTLVVLVLARPRAKKIDTDYEDGLRALLDSRDDEALRRLRDAVVHDTDNVDAYIRLGRLIRERGNAEKAAQIHQSLTVRPTLGHKDELMIYEELTEDYLVMGRTEKAISLLKELVRLAKDKLFYLRRLLGLFLSRKRTDEAIEVLHRNERLLGKEGAMWNAEIARLQWEKGEEAKAQDTLKHAQRLSKDHPYVLIVQAQYLAKTDQQAKARAILEKFLKLYPQHAEAVLDLAEQVYFDLGIYDKIGSLYDGLLKRHPEKREVRLRLARLRDKEGSHEEAAALINAALHENPNDVAFILEHAKLNLSEGKCEAAAETIERLEKALVLEPSVCSECGEVHDPAVWFCSSCGSFIHEL